VSALYDVVILGAGPAGLTAALYAARAKLSTLVVTGPLVGGQITLTYNVDNYPGFSEGVGGVALADRFRAHAQRFGAEFLEAPATGVDFSGKPLRIVTRERTVEARSVIIATGLRDRRLGVPGEDRLQGRGVFHCATCDAAFYEGKKVLVVGGGDSAIQEALDLARFASEVTLVHRRDSLRACRCLTDAAKAEQRIRFLLSTVVEEITGEKKVEGARLRDLKTGKSYSVPSDGVLIAIGWYPNTSVFDGQIDMDEEDYIANVGVKTSVAGVFVAGDLVDRIYRQVVTACASGCQAAVEVEHWLLGIGES
jgi:thioredoxin reductase (NADPH)